MQPANSLSSLLSTKRRAKQLVDNTFFAQNHAVKQIAFAEVGPQAARLAFASVAELAPFLTAGKVISKAPLGVLATTPLPPDQSGTLQVEMLRFPALYRATNDAASRQLSANWRNLCVSRRQSSEVQH